MSFSPLETVLIAFASAVLTAVVARQLATKNFITRMECLKNHIAADLVSVNTSKVISDINMQLDIIFCMIKGIVVYSDMSNEVKEKILNTKGDHPTS